jgi:hypothetical protein
MGKHPGSVDNQVFKRIQSKPPGWVFTPADFFDLGSRVAVATALMRLKAAGIIRQLGRGLYDIPRHNKALGKTLWPTPEAVTRAIQTRSGIRLQPAGAYAANLLGLSEQVPAKIIYLTDGKTGIIKAGPLRIELKRTTPRNMAVAGKLSGMLIQAFRNLGERHIEDHHIKRLRKTLPAKEREAALADLAYAPVWMHRLFRELARP